MTNEINENDVLCGRGGATNTNEGNKRFRGIVADHQPKYLQARKKDKAAIARSIVRIVREKGGRFLKRNNSTGVWNDIGDKQASSKTSQALREGLEVRRNTGKSQRRNSDSSSSYTPKKKRRRVESEVTAMKQDEPQSPTLISDSGEFHLLPDLEDEASLLPPFIFEFLPASYEFDAVVEV